jgi:hypothetical protein
LNFVKSRVSIPNPSALTAEMWIKERERKREREREREREGERKKVALNCIPRVL